MPENNFEKQVQQKMDELQLRPSAEVWQEVEKRIRKEKKRRGMVLFILLALLLAGGAGWWMIAGDKTKSSATPVAETKNENTENKLTIPENKNEEIEKRTTEKIEAKQDDKNETIKNNTPGNSTVAEVKVATDKKVTVPVLKKVSSDEASAIATLITGVKNKKQKETKPVITEMTKTEVDAIGKNKTEVPVINDEIVTTTAADEFVADSAVKKDVAAKNVVPDIELVKDTATQKEIEAIATTVKNNPYPIVSDSSAAKQTETVAKKENSKEKKSKWELGFTTVVGVSNKAKAISVFGSMNKSLDYQYSSPITGAPNQSQTRPVPYISPASPEKGNFWQVGMYAKRKFSERIGLSVGLNFSSFSTIQQTGVFADATLAVNSSIPGGTYYTSGSTGTLYTNHYYYLQLPVAFHWQLNKGNKLPITWQNGFSTGLFLGGDALVYNSASNVFYKDNKSFNKIQLSYQSGLYVKLFNQRRHPLTAGVLFNYHLSEFQNKNIYGGNHLSSFGFQLGWLLKK